VYHRLGRQDARSGPHGSRASDGRGHTGDSGERRGSMFVERSVTEAEVKNDQLGNMRADHSSSSDLTEITLNLPFLSSEVTSTRSADRRNACRAA
jgi:hypothetical protein